MAPSMTFRVDDLIDADKLKHGPLVVYWGQDGYVAPNKDIAVDWRRPPRYRWLRLLGCRPFRFNLRVAPPAGENLDDWGRSVADRLGVPWMGTPEAGDVAVWLPGLVMAKSAGEAVGSIQKVFDRLDGFFVSAVQIEAFEVKPGEAA